MNIIYSISMAALTAGTVLVLACGVLRADPDKTAMPIAGPDELSAQVLDILRESPLIDGHNDLPWQYWKRVRNHLAEIDLHTDTSGLEPSMHTDIARLRQGGIGGQFWSVYIPVEMGGPGAVRTVLGQIDLVHRLIDRYDDTFELALTADDIMRIHGSGKIASLIGMEGGHSIESSLAVLRMTYAVGARYMTLTHATNTRWADSGTDAPKFNGLTAFGREVVREMNRMGMLVDISHVSPKTMHDALDVSEAPVMFSHSSIRGISDHPRTVPDDVLRRIPNNGGIVMVTFVSRHLNAARHQHRGLEMAEETRLKYLYPELLAKVEEGMKVWAEAHPVPPVTLSVVADHIDYIREVSGIDSIGLGSDYDGTKNLPSGLEDVSKFPDLLAELLHRGYSAEDIKKIAGLNFLRVFRQAEAVASRLQKERPASDALIEELDGCPEL